MTNITKYAICVTLNYYGPRATKSRLKNDDGSEWRGTRAQARAMISETAHNESGRAEYTIVRAG